MRRSVSAAVLGSRYGSPLPGDAEERSIVEWEFDVTREASRENLESMPFVEQGAAAGGEPRQKSFLAEAAVDVEALGGRVRELEATVEALQREVRRLQSELRRLRPPR